MMDPTIIDERTQDSINDRIVLYRDVWIAAIASSRTRVTTLSGVKCNTSQ